MEEDVIDYAQSAIEMLEIAAMAYESGRQDVLDALSYTSFDRDEEYEFAMNGMYHLCDFMTEHCVNNSEIVAMYFSSNAIMGYYRLCREYGRLKNISLKDNPYMLRAKTQVRESMYEDGCYYCDYTLQTKVNHKWASGIVFRYDCSYFCEFLALFSRLIELLAFYDDAEKELRKEVEILKQDNLLPFPCAPTVERKVA